MPIALLCGSGDKLASPRDYMWLRDELVANQNCMYYKEYDGGHLYFLMPVDKALHHDILALVKQYNPLYRPVKELTEQEIQASQTVCINIANMTLTGFPLATDQSANATSSLHVIDGYLNNLGDPGML